MRSRDGRTLLWIAPFFSIVTHAAAAGPDLCLLNAVAEPDKTTIRPLLNERVDVNAGRMPDGPMVSRPCSTRPTGRTARSWTCCCARVRA